MNRVQALREMAGRQFDLLVVGGGITGAGIAREAALRGLNVALAEGRDFAYGTSSRSTKLIHGGLRYLKQFDFKLVRESVQERMRLIRMAPHLVRVMHFVFPVYRGDPDGLFRLRLGLSLYDWFAGAGNPVPHRILGPRPLAEAEPQIRRDRLAGGGVYCDCATDDGRLTLEVIQSASRHGAAVANYAQVEAFRYDAGGRIAGARVRDELTGDHVEVRARRVLAAGGPWADLIRRLDDAGAAPLLRLTKGVHLTVAHERLPIQSAVVMRGPDARMMFAIPAGAFTYLGTTDTDYEGDPAGVQADRSDVTYILQAANDAFPDACLTPDDVNSTWAGLRPLIRPAAGKKPSETSRDYALYESASGLVTVAGGKLTAFRAMASHIVDEVLPTSKGGPHLAASMAALPGAAGETPAPAELARLAARTGAAPAELELLAARYGAAFAEVVRQLPADQPDPERTWLVAQIRHAVESEMATRLEDVLARRTGAFLFSRGNGAAHIDALAAEMGGLLGWSPQRTAEEAERCRAEVAAMFAWREEPGR